MEFLQHLLYLFIMLATATAFGELAKRMGQSPVLGELFAGVILGISFFNFIPNTHILQFLAEMGAILLLFEIGISSNLLEYLKVGYLATITAVLGMIFPFILGYFSAILYGLPTIQAVFIGAILTATSIGITARVFSGFKKIHSKEARIILGAAVIDDILGLSLLAVVTSMVVEGHLSFINIVKVTSVSAFFLLGSIFLGIKAVPILFDRMGKLKEKNIFFVLSLSLCLLFSFISAIIGLASIVGAFVSGLMLSLLECKSKIEEKLRVIVNIFAPIFFVYMGTTVDIRIFYPSNASSVALYGLVTLLLFAAVVGKVFSGYGIMQKGIDRLLVGVGMIPRGEVGLIFANLGLTMKVISPTIYSAVVMVIILTTFITPFILKKLLEEPQ